MADIYTALEQQILHIAQTQRKADVHQHNKTNDLGRRVEVAKWTGWLSGLGVQLH